jgi:flagellar assembly factor FliW
MFDFDLIVIFIVIVLLTCLILCLDKFSLDFRFKMRHLRATIACKKFLIHRGKYYRIQNDNLTLIFDEEIGEQIVWLQSLEEPELCFLMFDPSVYEGFYKPEITEDIEKCLGAGEYACWVVLSVKEDFNESTVNLKSPVIINTATGVAAQTILEQDYSVRHPVLEGGN